MSISVAAVGSASFTGRNGAGSISVPGLKVGDKCFIYNVVPSNGDGSVEAGAQGVFNNVVLVDDQIHQNVSYDMTSQSYTMFFFRSA